MTCSSPNCQHDHCLATEGFDTPLCHDCWWLRGCPTIQPAILAPVVPAEMIDKVTAARRAVFAQLRDLLIRTDLQQPTSAAQLDWDDSRKAAPKVVDLLEALKESLKQ
jgi:hypothetical protein